MTPANMRNPVHFLAFGFGAGLSPKAPGTFGTLVAVPLWWLLASNTGTWGYLAVTLAVIAVGPYLCGRTSRDMGVHDHGGIVWDEFVGYWITMFMAPPGIGWLVVGFVLFRVFDIIKPWPIKWADEQVSGGLGIMLDDVIAGILACLCIQGLAVFV